MLTRNKCRKWLMFYYSFLTDYALFVHFPYAKILIILLRMREKTSSSLNIAHEIVYLHQE